MTLPPLPATKNKREAKWSTTVLRKWWLIKKIPGPFEVKYATGASLPFSAVAEHQLLALLACMSDEGFLWKIPDMGQRNPFDFIYYRNSPAWIVIKYPLGFCVISARAFELEMKRSVRRSLLWTRAREICTYDSKSG